MTVRFYVLAAGALWIGLGAGCDRHSHGNGHGHSHSDDAQSFSGATHKEGKGITLLPETKRALGIQTVAVAERPLAEEVNFLVRVFSTDGLRSASMPKSGGPVLASGFVSAAKAALLRPGLSVAFAKGEALAGTGTIEKVSHLAGSGEAEVVCALTPIEGEIEAGSFVTVGLRVPVADQPVTVVPREAVIRGTEDTFVYVVNGDEYLRACVSLGTEAEGFYEIKEGLFSGDEVVSRGAMDLWLVELRAVKGGQGCCPAPPAK